MLLAYARVKEVIPVFNERPLTEADFWVFVERFGVDVHQLPLEVNGFYHTFRCNGHELAVKHHIYLGDHLQGVDRVVTAWHEVIHFVLHRDRPEALRVKVERRRCGVRERQEFEAQCLAAVAILPAWMLDDTPKWFDIRLIDGFTPEVLATRTWLLGREGI